MTAPARRAPKRLSALRRSLGLGREERALLLETFRLIVRIRLSLTLRRFDRIRGEIVALDARRAPTLPNLRRTVWAVQATARLVPRATCLTQALAGQMLLARRGETSTIRLSVAGDTGADFRPHAWLISGETILLGGDSRTYARHKPLADYDCAKLSARSMRAEADDR